MAEPPEEKQALDNLDEATRDVAWDEFDKEHDRKPYVSSAWGFFRFMWPGRFPRRFHRVEGDPVPEPIDDEDPGDERGLRDVLRDADDKT